MSNVSLIAVDWGSTNFRAYQLDSSGAILAKKSSPSGVLSVTDFSETLHTLLGDWFSLSVPILLSGMVGSSRGWIEVPYLQCPVSPLALSGRLHCVEPSVYIVPGVQYLDGNRVDVMRGEEVQLLGALHSGLFCLPGTHSKWVVVDHGEIIVFTTFMTGELYNVITHHTILAGTHQEESESAFLMGVQRAQSQDELSALLFNARSFVLAGRLAPAAVHSFISGLLIGSELHQALAMTTGKVSVITESHLAHWYGLALAHLGRACDLLDVETVTVAGLFLLAKGAKLC